MKKVLNKWQWGLILEKCPPWMLGFYPRFVVWFLKFHSFPEGGAMFSKENYEGFYLEWNLNPIKTITVKTIAIPRWLKRIFPKMCDFYRIPYKFGFK